MYRIFIPLLKTTDDEALIEEKKEIHHIRNVLHYKPRQAVVAVDSIGFEYDAVIREVSADRIKIKIQGKRNSGVSHKKETLTVACALPKKAKFDDIVDKLTQLGVDYIIPMKTQRVIVKLDQEKASSRQSRWKKIALSASQQSQRALVPVINPVRSIEEVIAASGEYDAKLIPALIDERKTLPEVFGGKKFKNILVLIGPEGDFTPQEVELAKRHGFIPVTLGALVLRVDTAALAVASFIKLYYEYH
jgi:16S rRNA (uracil1498-N3)-methyltransferase